MDDKQTFNVEGIVSIKDEQPYIVISKKKGDKEEKLGQMTMAEARNFAHDLEP